MTEPERTEWTTYIEGTLLGSAENIEGSEYEHLLLDEDFCALLDGLIFRCEMCDWWCELSEMSTQDYVCIDCADEE